MFKRILIANRGEIACRVIKTARRMGIETVAVYSEADRDALHVEMADHAVLIGPPAAAESYLSIDKIVEACRKTDAEAAHPGYGFLSEREAFPRALAEAGIVFIGPNPGAIAAMGDKIEFEEGRRQGQGLDGAGSSRRDPAQRLDKQAHVQTNSDRQSRRDRLPGHQDCPPDGDQDGRRLFRGRPRRAPCRDGRRGRPDRTAGRGRKLSVDGQDRRGLPQDRRRGRAPRLRIPVRARGLSARASQAGIVFIGPNAGAIAAMGDKIESKKAAAKAKSRRCRAISA